MRCGPGIRDRQQASAADQVWFGEHVSPRGCSANEHPDKSEVQVDREHVHEHAFGDLFPDERRPSELVATVLDVVAADVLARRGLEVRERNGAAIGCVQGGVTGGLSGDRGGRPSASRLSRSWWPP